METAIPYGIFMLRITVFSSRGVDCMDRGLIILAWIVGVLIVFAFGKAMLLPLKVILRLVINGIIGGIVILIINLIGTPLGFTISLNPISALVAGILGLPGVILLVILKYLL
jgi:inhibitor of the pro-sigma K processing machinery